MNLNSWIAGVSLSDSASALFFDLHDLEKMERDTFWIRMHLRGRRTPQAEGRDVSDNVHVDAEKIGRATVVSLLKTPNSASSSQMRASLCIRRRLSLSQR